LLKAHGEQRLITEVDASQLANKLTEATLKVAQDYVEGDVSGEEDFSSQLCGRLKGSMDAYETESMIWQVSTAEAEKGYGRLRARTLSKVSEEPLFGADIVMTIEARGPDFEVKKGFLAQAKRLEGGKHLSTDDYNGLRKQCHDMLGVTSASYVFLYSTTGVTVISANAVLASRNRDLWSLPTWSIGTLYYDFAICWVGDYRLQTTSRRTLEDLRSLVDANAAIQVLGKPKLEKMSSRIRRPKRKI
jgi:hypothetical protein